MTKAFDLALFVGTPVNPGDGVVVNTVGPPLNTKFTPLAAASGPGVTVGASVPAATGAGQTLVSGSSSPFAWAAAASSSSLPPATAQGQTFVAGPGPGYAWTVQIPAVPPAPTASAPLMDGTPSAGSLGTYSRGDHVHPSDTSRYAATNPSGYQTAAQVTASIAASTYTLPTASTSVLGGVKVDGTTVTIASGVISATGGGGGGGISDAPNDSTAYARKNLAWSHLTHADITDWAANTSNPSGLTPLVNGAAAIGTDTGWSRGDHIHPTDTTRYAASNPSGYQTAVQVTAVLPNPATATPLMDGTAAVGVGATFARADHVHPTDTTRYAATNPSGYQTAANVTASLAPYAPLASPTFTGTVTIPTGAAIATPNIAGVTNASNAAAGQVGEWLSGQQLTATSLTSASSLNLVTLSLTAGDWDVDGQIYLISSGQVIAAYVAAVSMTSGGYNAVGVPGTNRIIFAASGGAVLNNASLTTGRMRVNVSATTNVYLVCQATFASGTCTAQGTIQARRMR